MIPIWSDRRTEATFIQPARPDRFPKRASDCVVIRLLLDSVLRSILGAPFHCAIGLPKATSAVREPDRRERLRDLKVAGGQVPAFQLFRPG